MKNKSIVSDSSFFVLDINNFKHYKSKVYGYLITRDCIYHNYLFDNNTFASYDNFCSGAYVYIEVSDNEINIHQDFPGSFGLYYYRSKNYWAISNSFFKLYDHLKNENLHLNKSFASHLLVESFAPFISRETPCKEIMQFWSGESIKIDFKSRDFYVNSLRFKDYRSIKLNTAEGMSLLDQWIQKYQNIVLYIVSSGYHLQVDVSGGFDSRIPLSLVLGSGVDTNKIRFFSNENDSVYEKDFIIAKQISKKFNFDINTCPIHSTSVFLNPDDSYNIFRNIHLGFHKSLANVASCQYNVDPSFYIGGQGGEAQRGAWLMSPDQYLMKHNYNKNNSDIVDKSASAFLNSLTNLRDNFFPNCSIKSLIQNQYIYTRCQHHFGRSMSRSAVLGRIRLSPLLDPILFKLDPTCAGTFDPTILYPLVILRTCPELMDVPYDSGREIDKSLIAQARLINSMYANTESYNKTNYTYKTHCYDLDKNTKPPSSYAYIDSVLSNKVVQKVLLYLFGDLKSIDFESHLGYGKSDKLAFYAFFEIISDEILKSYNARFSLSIDSLDDLPDYDQNLEYILTELYGPFLNSDSNSIIIYAKDLSRKYNNFFAPALRLVNLYKNKLEYDKCASILQSLTLRFPEEDDVYISLAEIHVKMKDYNSAIDVFNNLLLKNKNNEYIISRLSTLYIQTRQFEQASHLIQQGLRINPKSNLLLNKKSLLDQRLTT